MANPGPNVTVTSNAVQESAANADGHVIGATSAAYVGIWGATPVQQQTAAANVHTVAAGSTTAAFVNTTFDGSIGSTAYTIGDIVAALKSIGILKS